MSKSPLGVLCEVLLFISIECSLAQCKYTIGADNPDSHTEWVSCVRFSPNVQNPVIVSAGWDKVVRVWGLATCKLRAKLVGHTGYINAVTVRDVSSTDTRFVFECPPTSAKRSVHNNISERTFSACRVGSFEKNGRVFSFWLFLGIHQQVPLARFLITFPNGYFQRGMGSFEKKKNGRLGYSHFGSVSFSSGHCRWPTTATASLRAVSIFSLHARSLEVPVERRIV